MSIKDNYLQLIDTRNLVEVNMNGRNNEIQKLSPQIEEVQETISAFEKGNGDVSSQEYLELLTRLSELQAKVEHQEALLADDIKMFDKLKEKINYLENHYEKYIQEQVSQLVAKMIEYVKKHHAEIVSEVKMIFVLKPVVVEGFDFDKDKKRMEATGDMGIFDEDFNCIFATEDFYFPKKVNDWHKGAINSILIPEYTNWFRKFIEAFEFEFFSKLEQASKKELDLKLQIREPQFAYMIDM